jgi:ribonuclease P protein component
MAVNPHTLSKEERLCSKTAISGLFSEGSRLSFPPYRVFWAVKDSSGLHRSRFAVSVPKRRFKKAVERNLMKRRIRETFRLNKQILNSAVNSNRQVYFMIVYASGHLLPFKVLDDAMKRLLQCIAKKYAESR